MPTWCNKVIYWRFLSSTCFGHIRPSSGALDVKLQHTVFRTEFLDGWWYWELLHGTIQTVHTTYHPSTNSVQKTTCCNLTSSAPDDGRMRPKHVELRIHVTQYITLLHQVGISHYFMMKLHGQHNPRTNIAFVPWIANRNLIKLAQIFWCEGLITVLFWGLISIQYSIRIYNIYNTCIYNI